MHVIIITIILISSPTFWAQICNYVTLLAGRFGYRLTYIIIIDMH